MPGLALRWGSGIPDRKRTGTQLQAFCHVEKLLALLQAMLGSAELEQQPTSLLQKSHEEERRKRGGDSRGSGALATTPVRVLTAPGRLGAS